jgi:hypothetical protein
MPTVFPLPIIHTLFPVRLDFVQIEEVQPHTHFIIPRNDCNCQLFWGWINLSSSMNLKNKKQMPLPTKGELKKKAKIERKKMKK